MIPPTTALTLNYRDAACTRRCIDSLLKEGADNVLVWDNSADDGHSAAELRAAFSTEPNVHIVSSSANLGFAAGVNRGIDWIRRRWPNHWVFLINNDAVVSPNGLKTLQTALDRYPNAAIAYPDIDHNGIIRGTGYYQRHFGLLTFKRPLPGSFPYPSGCALLIAPDRIDPPLFEEDFFMYGEDWLLGWRHRDTGKLLHVPQLCVWHEGSAASGMASEFYETRLVAAHFILAQKLARSARERRLLQAGRWGYLALRACIRTLRYRSVIPCKALAKGWRLAKAVSLDSRP